MEKNFDRRCKVGELGKTGTN